MAESSVEGIDEFTCPVCLQVFDNPHRTACNHVFCKACLDPIMPQLHAPCPSCRLDLKANGAIPAIDIKRRMEMKEFNCECGFKIKLSMLRAHVCSSKLANQQTVKPKHFRQKPIQQRLDSHAQGHRAPNRQFGHAQIDRKRPSNQKVFRLGSQAIADEDERSLEYRENAGGLGMFVRSSSQQALQPAAADAEEYVHDYEPESGILPHQPASTQNLAAGFQRFDTGHRDDRRSRVRQPMPLEFRCAYCQELMSREKMLVHCDQFHVDAPDHQLVCPLCIAMPHGDVNKKSQHLLQHLKTRHSYDQNLVQDTTLTDEEALNAGILNSFQQPELEDSSEHL